MRLPYGDTPLCRSLTRASLEATFHSPGPSQTRIVPSPGTQAAWDAAKEVCIECPVFLVCRENCWGEQYGVLGGTDQRERHLYRHRLFRALKAASPQERAAVAARLWRMHTGRHHMTPETIARRTGYSVPVVSGLLQEHQATLPKAAGPEARVPGRLTADETERLASALSKGTPMREIETLFGRRRAVLGRAIEELATEMPEAAPQWPSAPPPGDAWVWHHGMARSGQYRGQSADGRWLFMTMRTGRRVPTRLWFAAQLVQMRRPVVVTIIERGEKIA